MSHQVGDLFQQFLVLLDDLVALQPGELVEAQLEDGGDLLGADEITAVGQARDLVVDGACRTTLDFAACVKL